MNYRKVKLNSGKEILLGRTAENNEELVNEFKGKANLMMHTVAPGSPFCVALEKPSASDKKQMASFCASYSQDWRDNKKDVKVHVFTGKQVYKRKGMKVGTFGVKKAKTVVAKKADIEKCRKPIKK